MSGKYRVVSGTVFGIIAVLQAARALMQLPVHVGAIEIPIIASWSRRSLRVVSASGLSGPGVSNGAANNALQRTPTLRVVPSLRSTPLSAGVRWQTQSVAVGLPSPLYVLAYVRGAGSAPVGM